MDYKVIPFKHKQLKAPVSSVYSNYIVITILVTKKGFT